LLTIHNKVLECMAMARPVLHGDGPAVRRAFRHGEEIYLCERLSGAAIATAIGTLAADPALCVRLAQNGYACFQERYTIAQLGQTMKNHLDEVLHSR
jgi:glycosyltransferase involved in cell wall biosynthesis